MTEFDPVHKPQHYNRGKVECIDAIESAVAGLTGPEAVCAGNVIKYVWRFKDKGGKQDLEKALFYLKRLLEDVAEATAQDAAVDEYLEICADMKAEIERLEAENEKLKVGWGKLESLTIEVSQLRAVVKERDELRVQVIKLKQEAERLKSGKFTPDELQNLCHNLHGTADARQFADGCTAEQRKFFGCAPDSDALEKLKGDLTAAKEIIGKTHLAVDRIRLRLREADSEFHGQWNNGLRTGLNFALKEFDMKPELDDKGPTENEKLKGDLFAANEIVRQCFLARDRIKHLYADASRSSGNTDWYGGREAGLREALKEIDRALKSGGN